MIKVLVHMRRYTLPIRVAYLRSLFQWVKMFSAAVLSSLVVAVVLGQDDCLRCEECIMEMQRFGFVDCMKIRTPHISENAV